MIRFSPARSERAWLIGVTAVALAVAQVAASAQTPDQITSALDGAFAKYKNLKEGANADYIPALAKVDPNIYGIALVTVDGNPYAARPR